MLEVQLAATGGIDRGLRVVVIPMSCDISTCQLVSIYIELLTKGEFVILLVFVSVSFDVNKGQVPSKGTG